MVGKVAVYIWDPTTCRCMERSLLNECCSQDIHICKSLCPFETKWLDFIIKNTGSRAEGVFIREEITYSETIYFFDSNARELDSSSFYLHPHFVDRNCVIHSGPSLLSRSPLENSPLF